MRVLWVLGATGSYPLEEIFPRADALGTLGVDGAVAAAISEPLMRGVFPGVGGMVTATAFKSPCGDAFGCWICRRKYLSRDSCVVAGIGNLQ